MDITEIEKRIDSRFGTKTATKRAELIGVSVQNYTNKKKRGTLIYDLLDWAIENGINTNWLITGNGPERSDETLTQIELKHIRTIKQFDDPELGLQINEWLVALQKDPKRFAQAVERIRQLRGAQALDMEASKKSTPVARNPESAPGGTGVELLENWKKNGTK